MKQVFLLIFLLSCFGNAMACYDASLSTKQNFDNCLGEAEQGDANAQNFLGLLYANGRGVSKDSKQAVKWYKKAAEQGEVDAQYNLGYMYANGQGLTQDYKQAAKWYTKVAEQGDVDAQYNLGYMYANGQGVTQDYVIALMWWSIAGSTGFEEAVKNRDIVAKKMTPEQIQEAQQLALEWAAKRN